MMNINNPRHYRYLKHSKWMYLIRTVIQGVSRRILSWIGLLSDISAFQKATRSRGANYFDYLYLYLYIRIKKPKYILECGSGVTTYVVCSALAKNKIGTVITLEQSPDWRDILIRTLPKEYNPYYVSLYSPCIEKTYRNITGIGYKYIPDYPYEFIIIDGCDPEYGMKAPVLNMDYFDLLERKVCPKGYVSSRFRTSYYYRFMNIRVHPSPWFKCGFIY